MGKIKYRPPRGLLKELWKIADAYIEKVGGAWIMVLTTNLLETIADRWMEMQDVGNLVSKQEGYVGTNTEKDLDDYGRGAHNELFAFVQDLKDILR